MPVVVEERITMATFYTLSKHFECHAQTKVHVRLCGLVVFARVLVALQRTCDVRVTVCQREELTNIRCETDGADANVPLIDLVLHPVDNIQHKVYATLEVLLPATELAIDHRCGVVQHKHDVFVACLHGCGGCGRTG